MLFNNKKLKYPHWTPEWLKLIFRVGFRLSIIGFVFLVIISIFYWILATQYDLAKVAQVRASHITYYNNGQEISSRENKKANFITASELNQHTKLALLAREDTNFYHHCGVDFKGIVRATVKNILSKSYKEGASTISMQLTKNTFNNKSKSIHRKLLEIAITLRLEGHYEKDEILTHYLNRIYFGAGCHGIEEAAQTYFNKTTKDLTLGQSAMLMGIIRGPHIFSPFNPKNGLANATEQRDQVLKRMTSLQYITPIEAETAKNSATGLVEKGSRKSTSNYALQSIKRHRQSIIDKKKITDAGLHVYSTINQQLLTSTTADFTLILPPEAEENPLQVASVIIENKSGAVRSIIGGRNFLNSSYNRALDSKQELGAIFYPFIYLAALERGRIPILDQPQVTGRQIGADELMRFSKRFGIHHQPAQEASDLYRGNIYATPLQLATALSILKTEGNRIESYFIEAIKDSNDNALFTHQHYEQPVANSGNANSVAKMISRDQPITSMVAYPYKHAWIITQTDTHTAVTWIGHDKAKTIPNKKQLCESIRRKMLEWLKND